jgi:hypothetical protein
MRRRWRPKWPSLTNSASTAWGSVEGKTSSVSRTRAKRSTRSSGQCGLAEAERTARACEVLERAHHRDARDAELRGEGSRRGKAFSRTSKPRPSRPSSRKARRRSVSPRSSSSGPSSAGRRSLRSPGSSGIRVTSGGQASSPWASSVWSTCRSPSPRSAWGPRGHGGCALLAWVAAVAACALAYQCLAQARTG